MSLKRDELEEIRVKRIREWKEGGKRKPLKIGLYPTFRCNLNCTFCRGAKYRKNEKFVDLDGDIWIDFVKQAVELGARWWYISGGGEPFMLQENLFKILDEINNFQKESFKKIITNGTFLDEENVNRLIEGNVNEILISLDGTNARVHDDLRGREGAFKKVLKGLENLEEARPGNVDMKVILNSIVHSKNYKNLKDYLEIAEQYNVDEIVFHSLETEDVKSNTEDLTLSSEQERNLGSRIRKLCRIVDDYNVNLDISALHNSLNVEGTDEDNENDSVRNGNWIDRAKCFEPLYTILVDHWGNVSPCICTGEGYENMNISDKSIKDIWYSDFFENIIKKVLNGQKLELCGRCGKQNETETIRNQLKQFGERN